MSDIWLQERPQLIWFTLQLWNHHAATSGAARPWVAALGGDRLTRITSLSCGAAIPLASRQLLVSATIGEVKRTEARVRARRLPAARRRIKLKAAATRCFAEYGLGGVVPNDAVAAKTGAVEILFTAPALPAIGRLTP